MQYLMQKHSKDFNRWFIFLLFENPIRQLAAFFYWKVGCIFFFGKEGRLHLILKKAG